MRNKRKIFIPLGVTLILLVAFVAAWAGISQNDYVLKINGQKISMNEFNSYLKIQKKFMEAELGEDVWERLINDAPAIETARDAAKQSIIDTVVKVQQAKQRKVALTNEEKEILRAYAEKASNNLAEYGITAEEFAKISEDDALIDKLSVALYKEQDHSLHYHGKIDLESYEKAEEPPMGITTFNSRHILFSVQGLNAEEEAKVKTKAQSVLNRVLNGEDFSKLAREFSEDPGSKNNGGLYENIERGMFVEEYENAVLSINAGEIYPELVKSDHGYHIIKSEGVKNPEGCLSLSAAENLMMIELYEAAQKWVSEAKIEVNEQRYNSVQ